jgi:ribosomal protein S18 acetylase RimI-like enzyme
VLVAHSDGQAAGYIACQRTVEGDGQVSLLAVAPGAQRQGIGKALVAAGLRWCWDEGARRVGVVSQGRNIRALRLYEEMGFRTQRMQIWYHRWFTTVSKANAT